MTIQSNKKENKMFQSMVLNPSNKNSSNKDDFKNAGNLLLFDNSNKIEHSLSVKWDITNPDINDNIALYQHHRYHDKNYIQIFNIQGVKQGIYTFTSLVDGYYDVRLLRGTKQKHDKYVKSNGVEISDLVQEGMLGLNNAINYFSESKETLFYTYALTCIKRKMIDYVIASNRQKNKVLNNSIGIEYDDDEKDLYYLAPDKSLEPENRLLEIEREREIIASAKKVLSDLEFQIFELRINGFNHNEITEILDIDYKAVDNAIQRIKNKMKKTVNV